jgi:excinuclease ABC subunit C
MRYHHAIKKPLTKQQQELSALRKRVAQAPTEPGIYRWKNRGGDVLYVGKAKNLKNRLKSYVQEKPDAALGPWKLSLVKQITDFDVTVASNELEALILETNLIKELRPKYNVMMKDDKNYVYVKITVPDPYPTIEIVRRMEEDGSKYFGPYTKAFEIRQTIEMLHRIFPFRACATSLKELNKHPEKDMHGSAACLGYQIGQCCGLCVGAISQEEYRRSIGEITRFLKGDRREATQKLHEEMKKAATEKKFERAAELRDTLKMIERMEERQIVSDTTGEDIDVLGIAILGNRAHVVLLKQRQGKLIDEEHFPLAGEAGSVADALEQFLPQYYGSTEDIPEIVVIGEEIENRDLIEKLLRAKRGKIVELRVAERGKKSQLLKLAERNAEEKVKQLQAKWEAAANNIETALKELKSILELPSEPKRIEGYDISHLGGQETVGSMVVAKNGKASNKDYRSFTIRTVSDGEIDDYKSLEETLRRRCRHLSEATKYEEEKWKQKGIKLRKARKADEKAITEIREKLELPAVENIYKEILVAEYEGKIVATVRLQKRAKGIFEVRALWVNEKFRGGKLGHFMIRKALLPLAKIALSKAYIVTKPPLESYYSEAGFRHVHTPPASIVEGMKEYKPSTFIVMMYDAAQHKIDASLSETPDLLMIDGGKGQLNAALSVLKEFNLQIPVIGLAKREEEVFIPGASFPVIFPKDSQAKFLLQRLRDEAHRFANNLRKTKKTKAIIASALDEVPGIGDKTKDALLKKFGTVSNIRSASDEELTLLLSASQVEALRRHL